MSVDKEAKSGCGIFGYCPKWLQSFHNVRVFMACYVALCLIYGMLASYTSSMIPSLEKRFGFSSQSIGIFLAMNDVSHVLFALITAHFGGNGHRPRWISSGCILLGVASFLHAAPEVFFPLPQSFIDNNNAFINKKVCSASNMVKNISDSSVLLCDKSESNTGPLFVLGLSQFLIGVGSTALVILGLPFIDDNVKSRNTPLYFAISFSGRIFGPVLGFTLGAWCNSIYYDHSNPGFSQTDPRFLSAWYQGYLLTGILLTIFAFIMAWFPPEFPSSKVGEFKDHDDLKKEIAYTEESLKSEPPVTWMDLFRNVKRLLSISAYVCRVIGNIVEGIIIAGYMGFLPKFLGQQYRISASVASIAGGVPGVIAVAVGAIGGGFIIKRFNLQPRHVGLMMVISALIMASAFFAAIGLGCDKLDIRGLPEESSTFIRNTNGSESKCHMRNTCNCLETTYDPVCHSESGNTILSPCVAGCQSSIAGNETKYRDCVCLDDVFRSLDDGVPRRAFNSTSVSGGSCAKATNCNSRLYIFVAVLFVGLLCSGIPLSGSVMIQFRVVDIDLKNMASGMTTLLMSGLGFLPGPIIFGSLIVDPTCKLWQTKACGERGYCLLYDTDAFRWKLHLTVGGLKLLSCLMDMVVTYKVWNLRFEREPKDSPKPGNISQSPSQPPSEVMTVSTIVSNAETGLNALYLDQDEYMDSRL